MLDWLACLLVKFISGLLCRLSPAVAVWLGERLGALAYWLQPKRTKIGLLNLRAAFNGTRTIAESRRIIRACYRQLGAAFVELLRLPAMDRDYMDRYITIDGYEHVEAARSSGRPVIFLTGHYGNWELSSIVAAFKGHPIAALARVQDNLPRLYRLLVSYRESKGCRIIHKGGAMKQLITALEQRQPVGIVGDQASRNGLLVDFFGRPALFAKGPFELAYGRDAVILPVFTHRVRGPFHRLVVEPPLSLPRQTPKDAAVRGGVEQFAEALSRHIREDPGQWLWMHKRWKHTPARRALILSDGKSGHLKQSRAVVEAIRTRYPDLAVDTVEVRYRNRFGRAAALLWSWWMPSGAGAIRCLQAALSPETTARLLGRYADFIVSCGAATAPINLLWAAENRAKSLVIMNPAPLPLRRFHLVIAPRHDALPSRPNVVQTVGAIVDRWSDEALLQAEQRLRMHPNFRPEPSAVAGRGAASSPGSRPGQSAGQVAKSGPPSGQRHPVVAIFIGGDTPHYELSQAFAEALVRQVKAACDAFDGWCLVTTSRRTAPTVERVLTEQLNRYPRCRLLLLATRDRLDGTMEGMLGSADVAVVTGESISMVSEACASGRPVVVVEPPLRQASRATLTKHQRFLRDVVTQGYARQAPVPEAGLAIQRALKERSPARRLDNFAAVREAVGRLL